MKYEYSYEVNALLQERDMEIDNKEKFIAEQERICLERVAELNEKDKEIEQLKSEIKILNSQIPENVKRFWEANPDMALALHEDPYRDPPITKDQWEIRDENEAKE